MAKEKVGIITQLLRARALGKASAAFVLVFGMVTLSRDIAGGIEIDHTAETVLVLLLGGAAAFLWNSCDK